MSYADFKKQTRSRKFVLAHIDPKHNLKVFEVHSGNVYKKSVNHYVIGLKEDDTALNEASSLGAISAGEFFYDHEAGIVYLETVDNDNPNTHFITATYRKFYSNIPTNHLTHNLNGGKVVEHEARLASGGETTQALDNADQIGIALETKSNISLINSDGGFDEIFDAFQWENANISIHSWNDNLNETDALKIFSGIITDKKYDTNKISFNVNDYTYNLRRKISFNNYTDADGELSDSDINKPKKIIYGQVDGLKLVGADKVKGGYSLSGSISGSFGSTTITGLNFLSEVSPGDKIILDLKTTYEFGVESIESNTSLTISEELGVSFSNEAGKVLPERSYRNKNRKWSVSGHKLRAPAPLITQVFNNLRLELDDTTDLFAGDTVFINGEAKELRRVSSDFIVLTSAMQTTPNVGDSVNKQPINALYFKGREFVFNRDYSITNTSDHCYIEFTDDAEFNIARPKVLSGSFTFTNGSRTVTKSGGNDLTVNLSPRDWIRSDDITHVTYYEILSIDDEDTLKLRVAYAGSTDTSTGTKIKKPDYIGDDALVSCDCYGKEDASGNWIKNASRAVKDLLSNVSITNINTATFDNADSESQHVLSLVLDKQETARNVITKINKSMFGSLYTSTSFEVCFSVLSSDKPSTLESISDHDLNSPMEPVTTRNNIVNKTISHYRHFEVDRFSGESGFKKYEFESDFVNRTSGIDKTDIIDLYLYDDISSQIITQRYQLFNSLSQSIVRVKAPLAFIENSLNDKFWINFRRMYKRFGQDARQKIGIISKITKSYNGVSLEFSDLGNWFARVANITTDNSLDFANAGDSEKMVNGYIVDNDNELPDTTSSESSNCNLIG